MTTTLATPTPVRPGTAEQLARLSHFRSLDLPEVDELDAVAAFLIGDVGPAHERLHLWEELQEDCQHLWHLLTEDWDDSDVDELDDADYRRHGGVLFLNWPYELNVRHEKTVNRLVHNIEHAIWLARYAAREKVRAAASRPLRDSRPEWARVDTMADYQRAKGEI